MTTNDETTTTACLGTFADLGILGKELSDACGIVQQHADRLCIWCRLCQRKMEASIHDATSHAPPRRLALEGDPTICDECFAHDTRQDTLPAP